VCVVPRVQAVVYCTWSTMNSENDTLVLDNYNNYDNNNNYYYYWNHYYNYYENSLRHMVDYEHRK